MCSCALQCWKDTACKVGGQTCSCDDTGMAVAACHKRLCRWVPALTTMAACTHNDLNTVPTGACIACENHQVGDQVMLWQCVASYAKSHDEQQASAELGA